jgi:HEAT repeat protein
MDRLKAWLGDAPGVDEHVGGDDIEPLLRHSLAAAIPVWPSEGGQPCTAFQVLSALPPRALLAIDDGARGHLRGVPFRVRNTFIDAVLAAPADTRDAGLFLQAMSGYGHVRERTLLAWRAWPSRLQFIATTIRLADWVPQVREIAVASFVATLGDVPGEHVVESLPLLLRVLSHRHRATDARIDAALRAWLAAGDHLDRALAQPHGTVRQWAFAEAFTLPGIDAGDLVPRALADPDPVVALKGLHALEALPADERVAWLRRAAFASHPTLRQHAMRALADAGALSRDDLVIALGDRSGGVRMLAVYLLRERHGVAASDIYREWLGERGVAGTAWPVLAGYADTARVADEPRLRELLGHPAGRVRAAALRALARLGLPIDETLLARALADGSNLVVDVALRLVRQRQVVLDAGLLMRLAAPLDDARRDRLVARVGTGERTDLLCASVPTSPELRAWLDSRLLRLAGNGMPWWKPPPRLRRALEQLNAQRSEDMDPRLRERVLAALG